MYDCSDEGKIMWVIKKREKRGDKVNMLEKLKRNGK